MSRDLNGNYTLPAGNPVVVDDLIEADWANTTMDDIATAMQDSLSRSGSGGMLAGLKAFAGTINAPGYAWSLETASGWYRAGAGDFRYSVSSVDIIKVTSAGLEVLKALNLAVGANIASAATINLTTATGNFVHITGTTAITAVTLGSGMMRQVVFDGILTLTHHATNNNLPGAANITTAAGDRALYWSDGAVVYCVNYQRADGTAVVAGASNPFSDAVALVKGSVDATKLLRFEVDGFTTGTTRVLSPPNYDGTLATLAGVETFTNKTLTSPVMTAPALGTIVSGNVDAAIGGVRPAFGATATGGQSIGTVSYAKIQYSTEVFDTNANYDPTTNYRFTPSVAGVYIITASATMSSMGVNNLFQIDIRKSGTSVAKSTDSPGGTSQPSVCASCVVQMNGTTDYIEVYAYNGAGGSASLATSDGANYFSGSRIA